MIKIVHGKTIPINEMRKKYWELSNPTKKNGDFHRYSLVGKIEILFNITSFQRCNPLLKYLKRNIENILLDTPEKLLIHHKKIQRIRTSNKLSKSKCVEILNIIFDYGQFRMGKIAKWLAEELNLITCPYCNRQFISVITYNNSRKVLFDFDHFFNKTTYPCLALSFYNLIPSCTVCNSRLKHTIDFSLKKHLHPYLDCFDSILRFSTNIKNSKIYYEKDDEFEIELKENNIKDLLPKDVKLIRNKARNTAEVFRIVPLYNMHKDIVRELIQKNIIYNESYINDIYENYNELFKDKIEVYKFLLGNYVIESELNKRPLSKLIKDIAQEFKLLPLI